MYDANIQKLVAEKLPNQDFLEPEKIIRRPPTVKPKPVVKPESKTEPVPVTIDANLLEQPEIVVKKEDVKKALDNRVSKLQSVHGSLKKNNNRARVREQTRKKEVVELW